MTSNEFNDRPATQSEAYGEMIRNMGADRPQEAWILTPFDTWERNPNYTGAPQPHPEDDCSGDDYRMYPGEELHYDLSHEECATTGWPGDGSGEDDLADFNANEANDYLHE